MIISYATVKIMKNIYENPIRWYYDELYTE